MQLVKRLLSLKRTHGGRNHLIRGLSTAELVGIIIIVGILGAIGGTYISGLVSAANKNAISQNLANLNTVYASAIAAGATTNAAETAGNINTTSATTAIDDLNTGVAVTDSQGHVTTYQMSPPISTAAISAGTYLTTATNGVVTFIQATNANTP